MFLYKTNLIELFVSLRYICLKFLFVDCLFFFCKQKTAYEMRISDWSSDVCSSDLEQELDVQLVVVDRQRQQRGVETAFVQALEQHVALFLHQQQLQLREACADAGHHVRQQVGTQGGEDTE